MRFGDMVIAGESLYVLEVEPAGYVASPRTKPSRRHGCGWSTPRYSGALGRVYLSGPEAQVDAAAAAAAEGVLGGISGRTDVGT